MQVAERVDPRTIHRVARAAIALSIVTMLGNTATRFAMPDDGHRAAYDHFLRWNLPGHVLILGSFALVLRSSGVLDDVLGRMRIGIAAGAWTVVVGSWLVGGPAATLNLAFATIIVGVSRAVLGARLGAFTLGSVVGIDVLMAGLRFMDALPTQSPIPGSMLDTGTRAAVLVGWRTVAMFAVYFIAGYIANRRTMYEERIRALDLAAQSTVLADSLSPSLSPSPRSVELVPGARVGRYEIVAPIGAGGMGVVVRANDPELGREVAIKVVRPRHATAEGRTRLLREARALARLRHPAVVPIYDVGTIGDQVFVVMPFVSGGTLGAWLQQPRSSAEIVDRFLAAARGLAAAHATGLVHRDFKPDNVLLGEDGGVMIADFGLARPGSAQDSSDPVSPVAPTTPLTNITKTGEIVGTPAYMAPEQLTGDAVDARTDVFAFCVALWEGLFSARPFDDENGPPGTAIELLARVHKGAREPRDLRDVPLELVRTLQRSLSYSAGDRAQSMEQLIREVETGASAGTRSNRLN